MSKLDLFKYIHYQAKKKEIKVEGIMIRILEEDIGLCLRNNTQRNGSRYTDK
jgi:hypothetical protein